MYSLNGATGELNWRYFVGSDYTGDAQVSGADSSVMIINNGTIVVGSVDRYIYCLNSNGTLKWRSLTNQWVQSSAALYQNVILIGGADYLMYALNIDTGVIMWSYPTESVVVSSPAIYNGVCYFGSVDNNVYAINIATGEVVWTYQTGDSIYSSPAIWGVYLYISSDDGYLYSLNIGSGSLIWRSFMAAGVNISSPTLGSDGIVYVGCSDGKVYAFNGTTGVQLWSYQTGGTVESSLAIGSDGTIYCGSLDGNIYALR